MPYRDYLSERTQTLDYKTSEGKKVEEFITVDTFNRVLDTILSIFNRLKSINY